MRAKLTLIDVEGIVELNRGDFLQYLGAKLDEALDEIDEIGGEVKKIEMGEYSCFEIEYYLPVSRDTQIKDLKGKINEHRRALGVAKQKAEEYSASVDRLNVQIDIINE